jgi:hypothetical protein
MLACGALSLFFCAMTTTCLHPAVHTRWITAGAMSHDDLRLLRALMVVAANGADNVRTIAEGATVPPRSAWCNKCGVWINRCMGRTGTAPPVLTHGKLAERARDCDPAVRRLKGEAIKHLCAGQAPAGRGSGVRKSPAKARSVEPPGLAPPPLSEARRWLGLDPHATHPSLPVGNPQARLGFLRELCVGMSNANIFAQSRIIVALSKTFFPENVPQPAAAEFEVDLETMPNDVVWMLRDYLADHAARTRRYSDLSSLRAKELLYLGKCV